MHQNHIFQKLENLNVSKLRTNLCQISYIRVEKIQEQLIHLGLIKKFLHWSWGNGSDHI